MIFTALAVSLLSLYVLGQPSVRVSLEPSTCIVAEGGQAEVRLVIVSGSHLVYAGEFNVSYPPSAAKVTVKSAESWNVAQVTSVTGGKSYVFYRREPQVSVGDPSTVSLITVEIQPGATSFTLNLTYFKAANAAGEDVPIAYENSKINMVVTAAPSEEGTVVIVRPGGVDWRAIMVIAAIVAVAMLAVATVYNAYMQPVSYLLIDGRALRLRGSKIVISREDLAGILPPNRAGYITRKTKGGHFQIVRRGGAYFIQDLGSTNGTFVNGVDIRGKGLVRLKDGDVISVPGAFQAVFRAR